MMMMIDFHLAKLSLHVMEEIYCTSKKSCCFNWSFHVWVFI